MKTKRIRKINSFPSVKSEQSGFSLIELMVAITIGLFILGGLSAVFINLKQAFNTQSSLSQLQDDERLGITILKTAVEQSGYYPDPTSTTPSAVFPASTGTPNSYNNFASGQAIYGASVNGLDTLTVRFLNPSGSGLVNCLGQTNNTGASQIVTESFVVNAAKELTCSVDAGVSFTALTGSISSMSISYGVDLIGNKTINAYRTAAQTTAAAAWKSIKSVNFTLSMADPFTGLQGASNGANVTWNQIVSTMNLQ